MPKTKISKRDWPPLVEADQWKIDIRSTLARHNLALTAVEREQIAQKDFVCEIVLCPATRMILDTRIKIGAAGR